MKNKKAIMKRMDKKWSLIVRSKGYCEICKTNTKPLAPHHIITRRNKNTRWDVRNGCALCNDHHTIENDSAHKNPTKFFNWMINNRTEDWEYLNEKRKEAPHPYSIEQLLEIEDKLDEICP